MNFADEVNSFVVGDPVQAVLNQNILGRVVRIEMCNWIGLSTQAPLVYVKLIGRSAEVAYSPDELRMCKCLMRIPKGVSRKEKPNV